MLIASRNLRQRHRTDADFIDRAKSVHGDKFDYSKVDYLDSKTRVIIICAEHGDFEQCPNMHLYGNGCPKCAGTHKSSTEEFVKKARKTHGDKYNYSKVKYVNSKTKISIVCPKHGNFEQTPNSHLAGRGCLKCAGLHKHDTDEFIEKSKKVHGNKYDYSKVKYINSNTEVIIICPKHGEFKKRPADHKIGTGCSRCGGTGKYSTGEFIEKSREIHGDKYDYSKVKYVNSITKITVICHKHGEFQQNPKGHMKGRGCPKCAGHNVDNLDFIMEAKKIHGDRYDYSKVNYVTSKTKVKIICQKHGEFKQSPIDHKRGSGCPKCVGQWSKESLLTFLLNLRPLIDIMDTGDWMALARQGNVPKTLIKLGGGKAASFVNLLQDVFDSQSSQSEQSKQQKFDNLVELITNGSDDYVETSIEDDDLFVVNNNQEDTLDDTSNFDEHFELPTTVDANELKLLNGLISSYCTDEQTINYLVSKRVNKLWYDLFRTNDIDSIRQVLEDGQCQLVTDEFWREYKGASSIQIPEGFSFTNGREHIEPSPMQRLTAWKLQEYNRVGNWSGVGAGKTLSAIFAGRHLGCKTTVVIVNNNTVDGWKEAIKMFFPKSCVVESGNLIDLSVDGFRYVIINYEKFQQAKKKTLIDKLLRTNPDFIVVDELQSVKNRVIVDESIRRKAVKHFVEEVTKQNQDVYVLGMSATPCVNNLQEIRSLLELILGIDLSHMSTRPTWSNASAFHELLVCHGLRYRPLYAKNVKPAKVSIDGKDWIQDILSTAKRAQGANLPIEQLLCRIKMDTIISKIIPGTIIYTHYVDEIVPMLLQACKDAGYKAATFTGSETGLEKKQNKQRFLDGKIDVLIGSSAIGTGVDELQTVCSRLIFASLPWTHAEYEQIVGRVYRQGRVFDADVILPQVEIVCNEKDGSTKIWSRDIQRFSILDRKRTLMDCAIDGERPNVDLNKEHKMALDGLEAMIKRLESGDELPDTKNISQTASTSLTDKEVAERRSSELTVLNRTWATMKSETLHNLLAKEPKRWRRYHVLLRESRKTWSEVPFEVIAKQINRDDWLIADLGCGEALFADLLPNTVHSYDHIAANDKVTACDIAHMPCGAGVYDAAVMSLVCMGANWKDYFAEANRILKSHGMLFVAEPLKNVFNEEERIQEIRDAISGQGFDIVSQDLSGGFVYFKAIKQV